MTPPRLDRSRPTTSRIRASRVRRPDAERLESRRLPTSYTPAIADYNGDGVDDIASFRYDDLNGVEIEGRNSILMQLSGSGTFTGYEVGYSPTDQPVAGDFDGDGRDDPAVYGFQDNIVYGETYGTPTDATGPNGQAAAGFPTTAFPNGSGRFAYIPSTGVYPAHATGAVNGTVDLSDAKLVIVNIGQQGDLPAVADYDGDGKDDFVVYEPSKAQFLADFSSTFNPNADPTLPGNAPRVVPLGRVGDVPASADYQGVGAAQFAAYDAASGTFFVRPANGGATVTVSLGGPGDIPVSADFQGVGHADFAVYDPTRGVFLVRLANGAGVATFAVGSPGDVPAIGRFGDGRVDLATYTPATQMYHIRLASGIVSRGLMDPDAIPIEKTDDLSVATHGALVANPGNPSVLFLGDSITYGWPYENPTGWQQRIGQFNPADNGEVADTSQDLLWRIENGELNHVHPWVVVLNIGANDFVDRSTGQLAHTILVIMDVIHAKLPGTRILLIDLLPRGSSSPTQPTYLQGFYSFVEGETRDIDQNYLPRLATPFSQRNLSQYPNGDFSIDLQPYLSENPSDPNDYYASPSLMPDFLHPNVAGTNLWANAIAVALREMLHRQAVPGDFDGDGRTDLAVYLPSVGGFATRFSTTGANADIPYATAGAGNSIPAPGDYDGDGKTDFAVYEPATGSFVLNTSSTNPTEIVPLGTPGVGQSIPAPGDYDGDGRTDLAVYEPATGSFLIRSSKTGATTLTQFGLAGAGQSIPVPGDYDGDGRTDLAAYLPALGVFAYRPSSGGPDVIEQFGIPGAGQTIPVAGDFDGDGKSDFAVYLPALGAFVVRQSTTGRDVATYLGRAGIGNAIPAPGDYDGDGRTDLAVYDPTAATMTILFSSTNTVLTIPFGLPGAGQSLPVTARFTATSSPALGAAAPAGSVVLAASVPTTAASVAATTAAPAAITTRSTGATTLVPAAASPRNRPGRVAQDIPAGPLDRRPRIAGALS